MMAAKVVLVVDDEKVVHAAIDRILSRFGHKVLMALTCQEGLALLESTQVDLVLCDLMLPEMDGIEFLEAMAERDLIRPTVMITGYPTITTALHSLHRGAWDYLPKPFLRKELLDSVKRAFTRSEKGHRPFPRHLLAQDNPEPESGSMLFLPGHSWACCVDLESFEIGVHNDFLVSIPEVEEICMPQVGKATEQGLPVITLRAKDSQYRVFAPLSGRIYEVNQRVLQNPQELSKDTWLLKIMPSDLKTEFRHLVTDMSK